MIKASDAVDPRGFQSLSTEQGAAFHDECLRALRYAGFEISDTEIRVRDVGIRLDAITNNRQGVAFAWEFKGSWQGSRPGLRRSDSALKMIAQGVLLSVSDYASHMPPLFVLTSHFPNTPDVEAMVNASIRSGWIAEVIDSRNGKRLQWLANATEEAIKRLIEEHVKYELIKG